MSDMKGGLKLGNKADGIIDKFEIRAIELEVLDSSLVFYVDKK